MKPIIKLYRGYANNEELIVMGHIFRPTTKADYDFQKKRFKNAKSVIRLFRIKTAANFPVELRLGNDVFHTRTLNDGYFKFTIPYISNEYGWKEYEVNIKNGDQCIRANGTYLHPHEGNLGFISDIDDTFLVSYSKNPLKKLYVLLFRNLNDRKVFQGVVPHYQALSTAHRHDKAEMNAFFYVSSSEWNLYRFIVDFTKLHNLPRAVMLLKNIKTSLWDFFWTGRGSHDHKFMKIKHILEFYPNLKYTLLGDDSQHDPFLYRDICKIFPVSVIAVYIRQTGPTQKEKAQTALKVIASLGVEVCYFKSSDEAIEHSRQIGLIR